MKRNTFCAALAVAAASLAGSSPLMAQRGGIGYTLINYYRVAPDKVTEFEAFAKDQIHKVSARRVAAGGILGSVVMRLRLPVLSENEPNYAVVTHSTSFPEVAPDPAAIADTFKQASVDRQAYVARLRSLAVRTAQTSMRSVMRVGTPAQIGDLVRVDFHTTPEDHPGELLDIERRIYGPMFKELVSRNDGLRSWSISLPLMPNANEAGWSFITSQVFTGRDALNKGLGLSQELFTKTHPGVSYLNTMEHSRRLDKIAKVRLYSVVDVVGAPAMSK